MADSEGFWWSGLFGEYSWYQFEKTLRSGPDQVSILAGHKGLPELRFLIRAFRPPPVPNLPACARFNQMAKVLDRLDDDYAPNLFDAVVMGVGEPAYTVTEYLEGSDLASCLSGNRVLPVEQAVEFIIQTCDAVADAHSLGIVHRSIKPRNLFVVQPSGAAPKVKVVGWDLALAYEFAQGRHQASNDTAVSTATASRVFAGTPLIAPEQPGESRQDAKLTDIWSIGATLCELVTGAATVDDTSRVQLYSRIVSGEWLKLRNPLPSVSRGLEAVILKCLEPDKQKRYQSVEDVAVALLEFGPERAKRIVESIRSVSTRKRSSAVGRLGARAPSD